MSKIFLCQHIARKLFGFPADASADQAHANWWRVGCASNPAIDQVFAGTSVERGFFYPRAITAILWLDE